MFTFTDKGKPLRYTFFAPTIDEWYGNYLGDKVKISVFSLISGRYIHALHEVGIFCIHVSGNDDDYLQLDREWTWQQAIDFANNEIEFPVSKEQLWNLGFTQ